MTAAHPDHAASLTDDNREAVVIQSEADAIESYSVTHYRVGPYCYTDLEHARAELRRNQAAARKLD